ncbi:MAG: phosphotransferase family protein [Phycisphaeraceae bacterium]
MQTYPKPEDGPSGGWGPARKPGRSSLAEADVSTTHCCQLLELPDDVVAHEAAPLPTPQGGGGFGTLLEPVLRDACDGRLSEVSWFRTDWQRGGALTGSATWRGDDGRDHDVVVKLPVPPCERRWIEALQEAEDVVPHLYAHGEAIGGYDLAWLVMEKLPHGPLGPAWGGREFDLLAEAAGRFYKATSPHLPKGDPLVRDWEKLCAQARTAVRDRGMAEPQRWNKALKKASRKLKKWLKVWNDRPLEDWCHGDLHLANALTRTPAPEGPAVLIDFAHTRVGHWIEDAVYFEHLFWARRDRLEGRKLCKMIAQERKRQGLKVDPNWPHLAQVKRGLLAMTTPAQLQHEGDPRHVRAALEMLEITVG